MTIKYPAGSEVVPLPAPQQKPIQKRKRRPTLPGGNSQQSVSAPPKESPLRTLSAIYSAHGWESEYIKFPCMCRDWTDKAANALVVWRGMEKRQWCVCEVEQMSLEQMEAIA